MGQQTVEVKFQGEQVGSHTDKNTTYTLYSVGDDLYVGKLSLVSGFIRTSTDEERGGPGFYSKGLRLFC